MNSYNLFQQHIRKVSSYPTLKIIQNGEKEILKGNFDIIDEEGNKWNSFNIEIHHREGYPFCFPLVYEIGGKLPKINDWHINEKGSFCLTVPIIELTTCKNGIDIEKFLITQVKPYLFNQAYRLEKGIYAKDEFGHGMYGIWEYYEELFNEKDRNKIINWLKKIYQLEIGKKSECFCGRKAKFRKCHSSIYSIFKPISKSFLKEEIEKLIKFASI